MAFSKREAPNCEWCPHQKNCLYNLLGTKQAKRVWRQMRVANAFSSGEVVFHEGTQPLGVYVVCTGKVKISKSSRQGQELITRIESPGDLLGHVTLLAKEGPYSSTASAMQPSIVSMVDERTFFNFLLKFPYAALGLLGALAQDVRRGENKARDIAYKPARGRLADTLMRLMRPGKPHPVVSGAKRRDLADMSGLTVETVVRTIKSFEEKGLVRKKEKDLIVLDPEGLKRLSGLRA